MPAVPLISLRSDLLFMLLPPEILGLQQLAIQESGVRSLRRLETRMPEVSSRICRAHWCLDLCRSRPLPLARELVEEQLVMPTLVEDMDRKEADRLLFPLNSALGLRRKLGMWLPSPLEQRL